MTDGTSILAIDIAAIITISTLVSIIQGILRNRQEERNKMQIDGQKTGELLTEIGYIKAGIDDIKRKQEDQDKKILDAITRIVAVEASVKQAHKRIDDIVERRITQ